MVSRDLSSDDRRFAKLCDEANLAYQVLDGSGAYSFLNSVAQQWLRLSQQQACGRQMAEFLVPEEKEHFAALQARLRRGESIHQVPLEITGDSHSRKVLASASPYFRGKEFVGARFLLEDLSQMLNRDARQAVEQEREQLIERISVLESENKTLHELVEKRQVEARYREAHLSRGRKDLQELAMHLHREMETERTRLSREVHDELGQCLTGLKLDLAWVCRHLKDAKGEAALQAAMERIGRIDTSIDLALAEVRRIALELRPGSLDDLGLSAAMESQVQEFSRRTGILCRSEIELVTAADPIRTEIFRIFQEVLTNVARHSRATQVHVKFSQITDCLMLEVWDNGCGISLQDGEHKSLGLIGMRERATLIGGVLQIYGSPRQGTSVKLQVPLEGHAPLHSAAGGNG